MSGENKMIIITTDEDIIRQFCSNKSANTQIIDLDNNAEKKFTKKNAPDDIINSSFLAELLKLNSRNDQIYKRALQSTDISSSKPVKTPRRSIDMICAICGDKAVGYNYDALSCASCKVFFRRNANKNLDSIKCFTGEGRCSVAHDMNPKCLKCRLERCFAAGMRKDFMRTGENKQRKRSIPRQDQNTTLIDASVPVSNVEDSDELDHLLNDMNEDGSNIDLNLLDGTVFDTLSVEDWITIENIRSVSLSFFKKDSTNHPSYDCPDSTSAVILFSNLADRAVLMFINFFRQINEFEALDANDRFILIKYNLFPIYPILKCLFSTHESGNDRNVNNEEKAKIDRFFRLCCGSDTTCQTYLNVMFSLMKATEQDQTILSLLLIILMFSQSLSMSEDEPPLKDVLQVNRAQSQYVQLLWNYMMYKWGDVEIYKRFSQLLSIILQMQKASKMLRDYFYTQIVTSDAVDQLAPLMQTVLHIS